MQKNQTYKIKVNEDYITQVSSTDVNDGSVVQLSHYGEYHAIVQHESLNARIVCEDFNTRTYSIEVNGKFFKVYIGHPLDKLIETLGLATREVLRVDEIAAPMPGLVIDTKVQAGDTVEEGQTLLILKAMKMENAIASPRQGIIKEVCVAADQAVDKGQLLISFAKTEE